MRKTATSESREPVKLGKHQYFHVPAHVARRHCLAGNIDEPNVAIEALDSVRFFNCRMADMEGVETPSSFSCEIEGFRSNMSLDSFPDYRLAESRQERTDALLLILNQLFHRWVKIYGRQFNKSQF